MTTIRNLVTAAACLISGCGALAQAPGKGGQQGEDGGLRPYCPSRPSLGAGACTMDPGHVMLEVGLFDWQREKDDGERTDSFVGGDALLRVGVAPTTEVQLGWTAIGHERVRTPGEPVEHQTRTGDVTLAVRQNLHNPDGQGFSIALQPFVTAPVGRMPIGAGTWGAGMVVPVGYQINDSMQLQLTGEADAASDGDGHGRHPAYSAILGFALSLHEQIFTTAELSAARDRDPEGSETFLLAALSGAYQLNHETQIDGGTVLGLNAAAPAVRMFVGFSHRF